MNSTAHLKEHDTAIRLDEARPARGNINLIACQYDGAVVHYLIMSDVQLADPLADDAPQLTLFRMLQAARTDLTLTDFQRFDCVIQFGQAEMRVDRAARDHAYAQRNTTSGAVEPG